MALYRCEVKGVQPSSRSWSFRINFSSSSAAAAVEADWLAQITSFWTNGSHGVETLFPTATVLETTSTTSLTLVSISGVDKLRSGVIVSDNPALAGTSANAGLPDQNAVLVSLRTGLSGREARGRIHLPAPDETLVTTGELGTTPTTRVSTAMAALLSGMGGAGHQAVVLTYVKPKTGTAVGSTRSITFAETDRVVRTLRGRVKSRQAVYL